MEMAENLPLSFSLFSVILEEHSSFGANLDQLSYKLFSFQNVFNGQLKGSELNSSL